LIIELYYIIFQEYICHLVLTGFEVSHDYIIHKCHSVRMYTSVTYYVNLTVFSI